VRDAIHIWNECQKIQRGVREDPALAVGAEQGPHLQRTPDSVYDLNLLSSRVRSADLHEELALFRFAAPLHHQRKPDLGKDPAVRLRR
jgi:hypothetical protein